MVLRARSHERNAVFARYFRGFRKLHSRRDMLLAHATLIGAISYPVFFRKNYKAAAKWNAFPMLTVLETDSK